MAGKVKLASDAHSCNCTFLLQKKKKKTLKKQREPLFEIRNRISKSNIEIETHNVGRGGGGAAVTGHTLHPGVAVGSGRSRLRPTPPPPPANYDYFSSVLTSLSLFSIANRRICPCALVSACVWCVDAQQTSVFAGEHGLIWDCRFVSPAGAAAVLSEGSCQPETVSRMTMTARVHMKAIER